ncbi:hypothetical protein IIV6-T1_009 [Invertebrate iridescent virus 6]|nr:hypothetical protein IIV6-T1_009 [Invertebrate iridescent virus 6]
MDSLNEVCYEQIKDTFYKGLFGDFPLIVDKKTGCFNATKLCVLGGKRFVDWNKTLRSKKLIQYYETRCDIKTESLLYEIKRDNNDEITKQITGTYLPKEFLQPIIDWIKTPSYTSKQGVVYVVTTSMLKFNNIYKIGYTKNFNRRLDTFNDYRHSSEPQFYAVALYNSNNAKKLETTIHKKLAKFRSEGEFFQCEIDHIKEQFKDEECEYVEEEYEEDNDNLFQQIYDDNLITEKFKQLFL